MEQYVYPGEATYAEQLEQSANRFATVPLMAELKTIARQQGLWNLFIPETHAGFSDHGGARKSGPTSMAG